MEIQVFRKIMAAVAVWIVLNKRKEGFYSNVVILTWVVRWCFTILNWIRIHLFINQIFLLQPIVSFLIILLDWDLYLHLQITIIFLMMFNLNTIRQQDKLTKIWIKCSKFSFRVLLVTKIPNNSIIIVMVYINLERIAINQIRMIIFQI